MKSNILCTFSAMLVPFDSQKIFTQTLLYMQATKIANTLVYGGCVSSHAGIWAYSKFPDYEPPQSCRAHLTWLSKSDSLPHPPSANCSSGVLCNWDSVGIPLATCSYIPVSRCEVCIKPPSPVASWYIVYESPWEPRIYIG